MSCRAVSKLILACVAGDRVGSGSGERTPNFVLR